MVTGYFKKMPSKKFPWKLSQSFWRRKNEKHQYSRESYRNLAEDNEKNKG